MSDSESSENYDNMDPEGYDVAHGAMYKMARKFKENNEEQLEKELDSLVYRSKPVSSSQIKDSRLRDKPEEDNDDSDDIDPEEILSDSDEDIGLVRKSQALGTDYHEDQELPDDSEDEGEEDEEEAEGEEDEEKEIQRKRRKIDEKFYEQSEDEVQQQDVDELEKIDKIDTGFKDKVMMDNLQDLHKAKIVKEQKKVLEEVVAQRMAIQPATLLLKYNILIVCV